MIPYIMVIAGVLISLGGLIGLVRLLLQPVSQKKQIVFKGKTDFVSQETTEEKKLFKRSKKQLGSWFSSAFFGGALLLLFGIYLGYAAKGDSFWFYKQLFGEEVYEDYRDNINGEGKYVSDDGKEYTYYVIVSGREYHYRGEKYSDFEELENKLSTIPIGNTVVLVDCYAVSAEYKRVEDKLNRSGLKVVKEEK